ncbi:hypothetical protein AA0117_g9434 [Alternaria alternata]|uniref:C2H2-domain containing protein second zinc finger domain-containing protein n=1 Tax=Alternaria alternata TaxID=5599 RepID=A0A4V1WQT6_ALTAL|nr:hypothetical protein AA0117_g9434 [Alternaria alternata]
MPSLSEQHVPNQTQFRPPRTVTSKRRAESHNPPETTDSQNPQERVPIGVIYSNGGPGDQFVCSDPTCSGITFNRVPDLKRHHSSLHDRGKQFWCPVDDCSRSKNGNGKPFPRKDKMSDHLEAVHFDRINS